MSCFSWLAKSKVVMVSYICFLEFCHSVITVLWQQCLTYYQLDTRDVLYQCCSMLIPWWEQLATIAVLNILLAWGFGMLYINVVQGWFYVESGLISQPCLALQVSAWFIWVRSRNCDCLVTWFCYQLIAKPGNKTATVSWPDPYIDGLVQERHNSSASAMELCLSCINLLI